MTVTHPSVHPRESAKRSPKHTQIMTAAHRLFLRDGYGATSMDSIADEAGVSKRTVYSHFGSKEALFGNVIGHLCTTLGFADEYDGTALSPRDYLRATGLGFLQALLQPTAVATLRVIIAEAGHFPELGELFMSETSQSARCGVRDYLAEQHHRGVLKVADPELTAMQFIGMIKGPYFLRALTGVGPAPTAAEIEAVVDQAVDVFLNGVAPRQGETA